jgi:hypothetical protein
MEDRDNFDLLGNRWSSWVHQMDDGDCEMGWRLELGNWEVGRLPWLMLVVLLLLIPPGLEWRKQNSVQMEIFSAGFGLLLSSSHAHSIA